MSTQPRPQDDIRDVVAMPAFPPTGDTHLESGLSLSQAVAVDRRPYPRVDHHETVYECCSHCDHFTLVPHSTPCPHGCTPRPKEAH